MRFKKCENCNKFSHCNNNNLVCVSEYSKLYKTITEIKEIAQGVRNYLQVPHPKDVRYEMDIILQKISEVLKDVEYKQVI